MSSLDLNNLAFTAFFHDAVPTSAMPNGPSQRISPLPETIALLEKLGAKNNHHCKSCS
jgi:hypothetical protein